jgi:hypothetical protein
MLPVKAAASATFEEPYLRTPAICSLMEAPDTELADSVVAWRMRQFRLDGLDFCGVIQKSTPLCAHEIAPGFAIRCPPPTMLATDAE